MKEVWSFLLYIYGLMSQPFLPCSYPDLLPASSLNTQQYLGTWYFIAAVSRNEMDIQKYRAMDSTVFTMEKTPVNGSLHLSGAIRIGEKCYHATWRYNIHPDRPDDLELEGNPVRHSLVWSGDALNCTDCIIFQEIEPPKDETGTVDSLNRHMLYARRSDVEADVVKAFQKTYACDGQKAFVRLPQEKGFCS